MSRRASIVDLTSASLPRPHPPFSSTTSIHPISVSPERQTSPIWGESTRPRRLKRRRENDDPQSPGPSSRRRREEPIDAIDLTEVDSSSELAKSLSKQREDAVKSQQTGSHDEETKARSLLGAYKCPICMDTPEDATSTACGHLFCHRCILECLATADARNQDSSKNKGTCPVCRKSITRNEKTGPRRSLIPLMLKLTTKKRSIVPLAQT
ncbi:hypothetical protein N7532_005574 [Penicillium argentinense]|uniref:RING-type domain-containing protein n=1 Tax=Penicillium argentinense TaxID=1131581 RepID=A0A9W9FE58_9EURO|nr:uncharacterized protein N7532_005574 [Penicillium argentinense]KAJ5098573.1 hypothetical protein N7532_005574 [Penicillium argentinense]